MTATGHAQHGQGHGHEPSAEMQTCIDNCTRSHQLCTAMVAHCLSLGGEHATPEHIRLLEDCADICATSANFMLRGSDLHHLTCGVCAEVCERCADDCERIGPDDAHMQECAAACRRCAESCRAMAQGHGHQHEQAA